MSEWNTNADDAPKDGTRLWLGWRDSRDGEICICARWRESRAHAGLFGFHMEPTGDLDFEYCVTSKVQFWKPCDPLPDAMLKARETGNE